MTMSRQASGNGSPEEPRLPVLRGLLPLERAHLPGEILAGATLAALAIPEVLGYSRIAGMPVITGLYTLLIPMALFALLGASRHLVVGADSATAAMLAAGLAGMAARGTDEYVALAGLLALMAAALLLLARLVRLGFLADFLSRTVLVGFLTGVGIQVAAGQVTGMLGISGRELGPLHLVIADWRQFDQSDWRAPAISVAVLVVVLGVRSMSARAPGALIAVVAAAAAGWALDLGSQGVRLLGAIPAGLPSFALPRLHLDWDVLQRLLPTAIAMFVVILAQSTATARAYAARFGEKPDDDTDLVGLAAANLGAGLCGSFVVNGSPTKTQMVAGAGGRSQLAQLVACGVVLMVLLFLTAPLAYLPHCALSAIVFLIGVELIDLRGLREIQAERPWEFWVALTTTLVVVFWGVGQGILLAALLSLLVHTRHGYRPRNAVIAATGSGSWRTLPVDTAAQMLPGLLVYRFTHSMYYANADLLASQVRRLSEAASPRLAWFCIDATAVDDVDFTAARTLHSIAELLRAAGVRLVFAAVTDEVRRELDRSGLTRLLGSDAYYASVSDAVNAYREK